MSDREGMLGIGPPVWATELKSSNPNRTRKISTAYLIPLLNLEIVEVNLLTPTSWASKNSFETALWFTHE